MQNQNTDPLTEEGVRGALSGAFAACPLQVFQSVGSTNTLLRQYAEEGAANGTVVVSAAQTAGRGRMGRSFFSPSDTGVYLSVLLRPSGPAADAVRLTAMAAVAVCRAVRSVTGQKAAIKWVNDVFLDGKKVCGILTESSLDTDTGTLRYAVVGLGVNVYEPEGGFPGLPQAGALLKERKRGVRDRLAAAVAENVLRGADGLSGGEFLEEYRRLSLAIGRRVTVVSGDGSEREAKALDVDGECRLLVRYDDGRTALLNSGEIRIRL